MNNDNYGEQIWEAVLEYCKLKTNEVAFMLWINPIMFLGMTEDEAHLGFSNDFKKKLVNDQFLDLISEGFKFVTGRDIKIIEYSGNMEM